MTEEKLARELIAMTDADKSAQPAWDSKDFAEQLAYRRVVTRNGDRLGEILDEYGWPTAALVGEEAARRAWLVAQHADRQLHIQRRALALLADAVERGEASARELAFLKDRVLVNEGREQIYGTQIAGIVDGAPVPWPCEDPLHMDARRAEVGIESFAAHTTRHAPA